MQSNQIAPVKGQRARSQAFFKLGMRQVTFYQR
jgi:hypothetical protein